MYHSLLSSSSNDSLLISGLSSISLLNNSRTFSTKTSRWWLLVAFFSQSNGLNILISFRQNSSQRYVIWYARASVIFSSAKLWKSYFFILNYLNKHMNKCNKNTLFSWYISVFYHLLLYKWNFLEINIIFHFFKPYVYVIAWIYQISMMAGYAMRYLLPEAILLFGMTIKSSKMSWWEE